MNIKAFIGIMAVFGGSFSGSAFRIEPLPSDSLAPSRTITQEATGITVSYSFPGAVSVDDDLYTGKIRLDIPGFGHNLQLGQPAWPVYVDSFEIPENFEAMVSVVSKQCSEFNNIMLSPARPILFENDNQDYTVSNVPDVHPYSGWLPESPAKIIDTQTYRDRNILQVSVCPIQAMSDGGIKACDYLEYRIDFIPIAISLMSEDESIRHTVDEEFMSGLFTTILHEDEIMPQGATYSNWKEAPYYLILSIPSYKASVEKFVEWKRLMGYNTAAIYATNWNAANIKSKIKSVYDKIPSLMYVLLIGDAVALPPVRHPATETPHEQYAHSSDYTFGCMDGDDDMIQDIVIGRLNVSNASEAGIIINKIINYEKNPTSKTSFYANSIHGAFFEDKLILFHYEDRRFTRTSEDIRSELENEGLSIQRIYYTPSSVYPTNWNENKYGYGEDIPLDLIKPIFKWDGNTNDIINSINSGTFYVFHRGHGSYKGWEDPTLHINSVSSMNNGNLLPVFFNINCQSGAFGNTEVVTKTYPQIVYSLISQSFTEALLRKANGGAVGVIAASEISYSGPNDALAMEMFQAIWPKTHIVTTFPSYNPSFNIQNESPILELGKILQKGMSALTAKYSDTKDYIPYTKRVFHCFGDPSMRLYTKKPQNIMLMFDESESSISLNVNATMSAVMKDGSVFVCQGKQFDIDIFENNVKQIMASGPNLIPTLRNNGIESLESTEEDYGITDLSLLNNMIKIEIKPKSENRDMTVRLQSSHSGFYHKEVCSAGTSSISINTSKFEPGVYTLELLQDGYILETRKILIK